MGKPSQASRADAARADLVGDVCAASPFTLGRVKWHTTGPRPDGRRAQRGERPTRDGQKSSVEFSGLYDAPARGPSIVFTLFVHPRQGDRPGALYGAYSERVCWDPTRDLKRSVARAISDRMAYIERAARA